jgi:hypothetical protein
MSGVLGQMEAVFKTTGLLDPVFKTTGLLDPERLSLPHAAEEPHPITHSPCCLCHCRTPK